MKTDDLVDAIGEVSDKHIDRSEKLKPRRTKRWVSLAVAAALLLAVGVGGFALWRGTSPDTQMRLPSTVACLAAAVYPERVPYTRGTYEAWQDEKRELRLDADETDEFRAYLTAAVPVLLAGHEGENTVCSPMDIFVGLAMLAETTGSGTRRQILDLLGQEDVESLRGLTNRAWNALYVDDGVTNLELSSSLWLRDGMRYDENTLKALADTYYASAFSGEMGSDDYDRALRDWLNAHTGGILRDMVGEVKLPGETVIALASTVCFKDRWTFDKPLTDTGKIHAPNGDVDVEYMHTTLEEEWYYWGDKYGAVFKYMEDSQMVLILPDEGVAPEELLGDPEVLATLLGDPDTENCRMYDVELTLPKFDAASDGLLNDSLKALGVIDAFEPGTADFTPLGADTEFPLFLSCALHGARVKVDEEGCEGAAYAVFFTGEGAAPPMDEKLVMTFDRPFLFAVLKDGLPIFTGIVNNP